MVAGAVVGGDEVLHARAHGGNAPSQGADVFEREFVLLVAGVVAQFKQLGLVFAVGSCGGVIVLSWLRERANAQKG